MTIAESKDDCHDQIPGGNPGTRPPSEVAAAAVLSAHSNSQAYLAIFGIWIFAAVVVWILILVTRFAFRQRWRRLGQFRIPFFALLLLVYAALRRLGRDA